MRFGFVVRRTPWASFRTWGFIYHIDDISRDEPFTVTVNGKPFAVVPYTIRNNDIARFDSPATTNTAYLQDLKDDFSMPRPPLAGE